MWRGRGTAHGRQIPKSNVSGKTFAAECVSRSWRECSRTRVEKRGEREAPIFWLCHPGDRDTGPRLPGITQAKLGSNVRSNRAPADRLSRMFEPDGHEAVAKFPPDRTPSRGRAVWFSGGSAACLSAPERSGEECGSRRRSTRWRGKEKPPAVACRGFVKPSSDDLNQKLR